MSTHNADKNKVIDSLIAFLEKQKDPEMPQSFLLNHGSVTVAAILDTSDPKVPRVSIAETLGGTKLKFIRRRSTTMRALGRAFIEAADLAEHKPSTIWPS